MADRGTERMGAGGTENWMEKRRILSDEFAVCVKIYEFNMSGEDVWFGKLAEAMGGSPPRSAVSRCIDRLSDRGMIEGEWKRVGERWAYAFRVSEEFEGFARGLCNVTVETDG
jgi:hypothetical protein